MGPLLESTSLAALARGGVGIAWLIAAYAAWRRAGVEAAARAGWQLYGVSAAAKSVALVVSLALAWPATASPASALVDCASALVDPFLGAALLVWPGAPRSAAGRVRILLDGAIFASAALFVVWTLSLPAIVALHGGTSLAFWLEVSSIVLATAYVAIGSLLAVHDPQRLRGPFGTYVACLGASIVADMAGAAMHTSGLPLADAIEGFLQLVPAGLLALAPFVPGSVVGKPWDDLELAEASAGALPHLACIAAVVAWLLSGRRAPWDAVRGVTVVVVVVALVLRQAIAVHDLRMISRTLDARVKGRTRELVESQAALVRGQRLDAVGQMAAGIAHDFNNLLTVVMATTPFVRGSSVSAEERDRLVDEIDAATERASALVRQILAFSRQQPISPKVFDARRCLEDLLPLLLRLLGSARSLVFEVEDERASHFVEVDPAQFEQVIVNLVANARDAMEEGGTLTVRIAGGRDEGTVCLLLKDTGRGMSESVMARIFEPFFTTKGNQGTGLGLATCYGIVARAGGRIEVESALGQGTTFRVYLPEVAPVAASPTPPEAPSAEVRV